MLVSVAEQGGLNLTDCLRNRLGINAIILKIVPRVNLVISLESFGSSHKTSG